MMTHGQAMATGPEIGSVVEATIERIVPGGAGLAHAAGGTLFVELAAPGDRVRIRVDRVRGRTAFATIVDLLDPSRLRVMPRCAHGERCGGCDFQHLSYDAQLDAKVAIVGDCLRRIAGIEPPGAIAIAPSPDPWAYRSRAEWRYDRASGALGYYERDSHRVCDVASCALLRPELETLLDVLRQRRDVGSLPAGVTEFLAVAGDDFAVVSPSLDRTPARELTVTVAPERYRFDVECFFQVNHGILPALVGEVLRIADDALAERPPLRGDGEPERRVAADLYCGVGLFTLPLARRFERVLGVESQTRAATYARGNAREAGLTNLRVDAVPVAVWLRERGRGAGHLSLVVLDPPRAGIDSEALAGIARLRAARIAYVSCDPATLARDLKRLVAGGYELASIAAFDMFPQTHHVETVAQLRLTR